MTDGLLLIHAFPLDARMWEPQLALAGRPAARRGAAPARVRRHGGRRRRHDDGAAAAERCTRGARRGRRGPRRRVRAVDGRLRGLRAVEGRPAARGGPRAREHEGRGRHARGRGRAGERWRSVCGREGTGSWWTSRRRCCSEDAPAELRERVRRWIAEQTPRRDRRRRARDGRAAGLGAGPPDDRRAHAGDHRRRRRADPARRHRAHRRRRPGRGAPADRGRRATCRTSRRRRPSTTALGSVLRARSLVAPRGRSARAGLMQGRP